MKFGLYHPVSVREMEPLISTMGTWYITGIRSYTNTGADEERKVYKEEVEIQKE